MSQLQVEYTNQELRGLLPGRLDCGWSCGSLHQRENVCGHNRRDDPVLEVYDHELDQERDWPELLLKTQLFVDVAGR